MDSDKTILLVEDEAIIALDNSRTLSAAGYKVLTCPSGEKALETVRINAAISLILMDIDLGPGMDGTEAARQILNFRTLPIVFLTSHSEKDMVDKVRGITRYGYVIKNAGDFVLLSSVEMALELFSAHQKVQETSDRYHRLVSLLPEGVIIHQDGVIVFANDTACQMIKATRPEDLLGTPALDRVHPDYRSLAIERIRNSLQSQQPADEIEEVLLTLDGSELKALVRAIPFTYQGRPAMMTVITDLSRHSGNKEEQEDRKDIFEAFMKYSPIYVFIKDSELRSLKLSSNFVNLVPLPLENQIGKSMNELFPSDFAAKIEADDRKILESGEPASIIEELNGKIYQTIKFPISRQNRKPYLGGFTIDITEQKRIEHDLHLNDTRMKKLLDIMQHQSRTIQEFLDYALDHVISLTSSRIGYIYHYSEETQQFTLNSWSKNVMAECRVANPETCYDLAKTGIWGEAVRQRKAIIINDFEASHPLKKGYPAGHVHLSKYLTVPVFSGPKIVGVVAVANKETDYTETDVLQLTMLMDSVWKAVQQKHAQEQVEKLLAEKEIILKEVHHRIKNNMTTIMGLLSLQANMMTDKTASSALNEARNRVHSMMLLYEKIYQSSEFRSVALNCYIPSLVREIVLSYSASQVTFETEVEPLTIDPKMGANLGIILNELLVNCMKHAFSGLPAGHIRVSAGLEDQQIAVRISNNGIPLPDSFIPEKSSGFGLQLVTLLIRQMDGSLEVSRDGGTSFTVRLPHHEIR